jgi:hypothetical protein
MIRSALTTTGDWLTVIVPSGDAMPLFGLTPTSTPGNSDCTA